MDKDYVYCTNAEQFQIVEEFINYKFAADYSKEHNCIWWKGISYGSDIYAASNTRYIKHTFDQWCNLVGLKINNNKIEKSMEKLMLDVLNKTYDNKVLRRRTVPLFMSNPGIGKTSIIKKFVEDKGVKMVKVTLSQRMPNEVVGMVMPDVKSGKLVVYDSHELVTLQDGDVLFFDEVFNGTLKQTLDAVLNLLEDRMLPSGKKLADVLIVAASNPQGLINLTPQIKERFIRYELKFNVGEFQALLKNRYGMPESISANICVLIGKEKFEQSQWDFVTPRSIEKAILQTAYGLENSYDTLLAPYLSQEITSPADIKALNIKTGEKVPYLSVLKLIVQNDYKNC